MVGKQADVGSIIKNAQSDIFKSLATIDETLDTAAKNEVQGDLGLILAQNKFINIIKSFDTLKSSYA